ncbi:ATP-binding cassette domain-containing protein [Psychrobacter sp. LV10R520-6]|uniref:ABC transporter ATP-binding protein n=1 Tax=Psychrobacter sp. LV10R520-6 TaxID=1415574 RepID=UPI002AA0D61E|nr:ATP-binding cassette domain-containing protein [Psychrobacter sp. LV10R520-6]
MSRKNSTHSAVSNVLAQYQKQHQKWLAQIKRRILPNESVANKSIPAHKRALIVGASGTLLPGQVTVLTGPSGSGKSILLRVLAGLSSMDTGDVWQYDDPVQRSSSDCCIHTTPPTQWRAQVALLAQHPQLIEGSVLDNLQMPYRLQAYQQSYFDKDWHIEQLAYLERTADFLQQSANHLSGGERQLVNTLRLLQLAPQVLLLDEPTAALDPGTSAKLVQLIINWLRAEPQRTLLWVTHDTQDIMPLANNHWHMQAGVLTEIF